MDTMEGKKKNISQPQTYLNIPLLTINLYVLYDCVVGTKQFPSVRRSKRKTRKKFNKK